MDETRVQILVCPVGVGEFEVGHGRDGAVVGRDVEGEVATCDGAGGPVARVGRVPHVIATTNQKRKSGYGCVVKVGSVKEIRITTAARVYIVRKEDDLFLVR